MNERYATNAIKNLSYCLKKRSIQEEEKKFPFPLNMMNYITSVTQMANYVSTDYLNDFGKR